MADEMTGGERPPIPPEHGRPALPEAETGAPPRIAVVTAPNAEEMELQALEEDAPSDPWSAVSAWPTEPAPEAEGPDPLQLTRVEETGLDTNRATQRIERLLDPVEGNQKDSTGRIVIRLLRRALRRLAALEEGVEQLDMRMAMLEDGLRRVEMRLPEAEPPSGEEPGPFG